MKQKVKYIIFAGLLGLFIGFLYNHIVIPDSYKKEMSLYLYKDSIKLRNSQYINKTYAIPYKETLILKIASSSAEKRIAFNNKILIPFKTKTHHRKLKNLFAKVYYEKPIDYVLIPADIVNIGRNYLKLSFPPDIHDCVTIKIENYNRNTNNQIFVLFKDSHILPLKERPIAYLYSVLIVLFIFLSLLWRTSEHIYSKFLISLLPVNILFLLAYIITVTLDLKLLITSGYFWALQAVSLAFVCSMFFYIYNKKTIIENIGKPHLNIGELNAKLKNKFPSIYAFVLTVIIINVRCLRYLHSQIITFRQWLKSRSFSSDKCVLLFAFILIACALFLIANLEIAAKRLANVAYLLLCLIVIIELVTLVKSGRGKGKVKR